MKLRLLTWGDGDQKTIIAPTMGAAINVSGKGMPATIDEIDPDKLCEVQAALRELKIVTEKLTGLFGVVV